MDAGFGTLRVKRGGKSKAGGGGGTPHPSRPPVKGGRGGVRRAWKRSGAGGHGWLGHEGEVGGGSHKRGRRRKCNKSHSF